MAATARSSAGSSSQPMAPIRSALLPTMIPTLIAWPRS